MARRPEWETTLEDLADRVLEFDPVEWETVHVTELGENENWVMGNLRDVARIGVFERRQQQAEVRRAEGELCVGDAWGGFTVQARLGSGDTGVVYAATHPEWGEVALKLLHPLRRDPLQERPDLEREGPILQGLAHPHLVRTLGFSTKEGRTGVWTKRAQGVDLRARLEQDGPLSPREAARIGRAVCGTLGALHAARLLDRDLRPQHVLTHGDHVVLVDCGTGGALRAPVDAPLPEGHRALWTAPEVVLGAAPSVAADVYAMGALLLHLVSGRPPHAADTLAALLEHHRGRPSPPRVPGPKRFARLVARALDPEPSRRSPSAHALEAELAAFLEEADG